MSVFLLILKIIGIVLLCIIGFVLFLVLYLLLAPFWYKIQGSNDRDMNYCFKVKASTFLHLIQVHVDYYKDEGLKYDVSMFGTLIKIFPRNKKNEDDKESDDDKLPEKENVDETQVDIEDKEQSTDEETIIDKEQTIESESGDMVQSLVEDNSSTENAVDIEDIKDIDENTVNVVDTESDDFDELFNEEDKRFFVKVRDFFYKYNPVNLFNKLKAKIEELKKNADKILSVVLDESNKDWLKKIFSQLKKLIKSLKLNMRGTDLDFSLGSPDVTGQVSGVLAIFPPIYDKKVRIIPDFSEDELYFDGDVYIKGRIHLVCVVYFVLVILLDSNTKRIINKVKELKEE